MQKTQQKNEKKIITANTGGPQEDVLARLPNIETIRRYVRRNSPNNHPAVRYIYETQFAIPQNYTVNILGLQLYILMGDQIELFSLTQAKFSAFLAIQRYTV